MHTEINNRLESLYSVSVSKHQPNWKLIKTTISVVSEQ